MRKHAGLPHLEINLLGLLFVTLCSSLLYLATRSFRFAPFKNSSAWLPLRDCVLLFATFCYKKVDELSPPEITMLGLLLVTLLPYLLIFAYACYQKFAHSSL